MDAQWHKPLRRLRSFLNWHLLDDRRHAERRFRLDMGQELDLQDPPTLNAKIQWLKLYFRHPRLPRLVDKYGMRGYVENCVGPGFLAELLGVYEDVAALQRDLPNLPVRFVLKATHGCGWNLFVEDKDTLEKADFARLNAWLKLDYYRLTRDWAYSHVRPRLIAERFHEPPPGHDAPLEYCIYCYNGEPQQFRYRKAGKRVPVIPGPSSRPTNFEQALEVARTLSAGWPMVRLDCYDASTVRVGELTVYPGSGLYAFEPPELDVEIGRLLDLSRVPVINPYTPRGLSLDALPF